MLHVPGNACCTAAGEAAGGGVLGSGGASIRLAHPAKSKAGIAKLKQESERSVIFMNAFKRRVLAESRNATGWA